MIDEIARVACYELSLLLEQTIQLGGNHMHHSSIRPKLEQIRKALGIVSPPSAQLPPAVVHTNQNAQVHHPLHTAMMGMQPSPSAFAVTPMSMPAPPAVVLPEGATDDEKMEAARSMAALYGVAEGPGCASCRRSPIELIAAGHGPGCAAASAIAAP